MVEFSAITPPVMTTDIWLIVLSPSSKLYVLPQMVPMRIKEDSIPRSLCELSKVNDNSI